MIISSSFIKSIHESTSHNQALNMASSSSSLASRPNPSLEKQDPQDTEKATEPSAADPNDLSQFGPAPDGGTKAWLNAFGGFCIFFGCLGFTSCFGVLQEYYSTHQLKDLSPSKVSWIGSVSNFIQFSGGAIGGPMFDRYGAKVNNFLVIWSERSSRAKRYADPETSSYPICPRPHDGQLV
jgi:hypothetical protein